MVIRSTSSSVISSPARWYSFVVRTAALIPSENKRDVADVPDAILTAIQWQFYDSPTRAAILAMGLG
jgi:hypothetical protein